MAFNFGLLNLQFNRINRMSHVFHLSMKKPTFAKMQLKVMFIKSVKHLSQMLHVIFWNQIKCDNIVDLTFGKGKNDQIKLNPYLGWYSSHMQHLVQLPKISLSINVTFVKAYSPLDIFSKPTFNNNIFLVYTKALSISLSL